MEEKVLDLICDVCEDEELRDRRDEDLLESGLLDSLAFAELLFRIEEDFNVIIAPSEMDREAFSTPNKIIGLVLERVKK